MSQKSTSHTGSPASSLRSPQLSDRWHSTGSAPSISDSLNAERIRPAIRYLNTPLTLTHSRVTSTQFADAPPPGLSRLRHPHPLPQSSILETPAASPVHSRPPSPLATYPYPQPHPLSQSSILETPVASPVQSRPPSPLAAYPYPQSHPLPQSSILETPAASPIHSRPPSPLATYPYPQPHPLPQSSSPGNTQILDAEPILQGTSEGYRQPEITVSPRSRSQTVELDSQCTFDSSQSPLPIQQGQLLGLSQFPTAGAEHLMPILSDLGDSGSPYLMPRNARHGSGNLSISTPTPSSNQAQYRPPLPQLFSSQVSVGNIPTIDASGNWHDGKTRIIRPMHSEQVSRYVNKADVSLVESTYRLHPIEVNLPQLTESCHASSYAQRPKGWEPVMHPEGALYFYNAERRIFTDVYMYDYDLSTEVHALAAYLERRATQSLPTNDYDLVLDIIEMKDDNVIAAYYYVDHVSKTLFWQEYYDCSHLLYDVRGALGPGHVKLRLASLYWAHWSLYPSPVSPNWRKFPEDAQNQLLGTLLSSGIDSLISKVSTSPFTVAEIRSMRNFIKGGENLGPGNPHVITSVARLLSLYAYWSFLCLHGQKGFLQDRYKSIYDLIHEGSRRKRTMLIQVLSPILFFFPDVHLLELERVWTGHIMVQALWRESMQKLVSEWTKFVLCSIVVLAANVAFLAIPGVIVAPQNPTPQNPLIKPSPAQVTSSISLVFSIGSIITGLLLIRHNRIMMTKSYLHGTKERSFGLEPLAIVFSLTYALLMWSAWLFFVALLIFSFQDTSKRISIPVGTVAGIIIILIVWCIGTSGILKGERKTP